MRITTIKCDRCGKIIEGYPVKLNPEYVDRETGDFWPDNEDRLPSWATDILDKDFCEECVQKIVRYAIGGIHSNPEFEQAVQEIVEGSAKREAPKEAGGDPDGQEQVPVKRGPRIDQGKVMALSKANWPPEKIAEELGVSVGAIHNVRTKLRKEGKL